MAGLGVIAADRAGLVAIADALDVRGLEADGRRHLREFHHVNELMDDAISDIKNLLHRRYGPFTAWLDRFGGGVDDILTDDRAQPADSRRAGHEPATLDAGNAEDLEFFSDVQVMSAAWCADPSSSA